MSGVPLRLWLRWSLRDLRLRWPVVAATALVLAVGTGLSAGLSSAEPWRTGSADASFAALRAHDLRVTLPEGARLPAGALERRVRGALGSSAADVQERLSVPTQVDVSRPGRTVLVPGRLVGADLAAGRPLVDGLWTERGRALTARDDDRAVGVLEANFAEHHELPATAQIRLPGGERLRAVGQARSPEWFVVAQEGVGFGGESGYAVVFAGLATAQRLAGTPGAVDEAVLRLVPGADRRAAQRRVEAALREAGVAAEVVRLDQESAHSMLYRDARNDQKLYTVFALLLLGGAAIAAFNLVSRVVEAQRREIGVGMALGVDPRALALRPLLLGAEIALLGVLLGVAAGYGATAALRPALDELLPLPVLQTPFQTGLFARAAAVGFVLPFAAAALPVWRAVRVAPVQAIRTGSRSARGGGLAPLVRRVRLGGGSLAQLPVRNVARTPRRTVLTVLGTGAVVATVVALGGMVDSFSATIDRAQAEHGRGAPGRLIVELDRPHAQGDADLRGIAAVPGVARAQALVHVPATLRAGGEAIDSGLVLVGPNDPVWHPSVQEGEAAGPGGGVLIAQRAAEQLGLDVVVRHPVRTGAASFVLRDTPTVVSGLHGDPFRHAVYADPSWAPRLALVGASNRVQVAPAPGADRDAVLRGLLAVEGVASVQAATATADAFDTAMSAFGGILRVGWYAALVLALLMAFNVASVTADERGREHATLFAFGVRPRAVVGLTVAEYLLVGLLATLLGLALGRLIIAWVAGSLVADTFPEIGLVIDLAPVSLAAAAVAGIAAIALSPVFLVRRLQRMDVPAALRVVE